MKKTVLILMLALCYGLSAQTDIYRRYAKQPHVKVASVSNFSINSKTQVDVTVIEAVDDAGWNWMMKEFSISPLQQSQMNDLREGADVALLAVYHLETHHLMEIELIALQFRQQIQRQVERVATECCRLLGGNLLESHDGLVAVQLVDMEKIRH